jgi:hypothetical protein
VSRAAAACALAAGCLASAAAMPAADVATEDAQGPRVEDLVAVSEGDRLLVSFRLDGAPDAEEMDRIRSGIALTYRHAIEVVERRALPLWPAKVLGQALVEATAAYDSLNRRYRLERRIRLPGKPERVEHARLETDSGEEAIEWLARVDRVAVPLRRPAEASERVRLDVESTIGRRYVLLLFPARERVRAETKVDRAGGPP